jgi:uncharacterized protein
MIVPCGSAGSERLVADAEVLQETLHRYVAINRREAIDPAIKLTLGIVDRVFPVEKADLLRASEIVVSRASLPARDAVHVAIMERHGLEAILSFDGGFDHWPGLSRLHQV